ncbi:hypothetical protein GCM10025734_50260 [Kitasatospora paranensis]
MPWVEDAPARRSAWDESENTVAGRLRCGLVAGCGTVPELGAGEDAMTGTPPDHASAADIRSPRPGAGSYDRGINKR